jgi:hypothetical protein
VRIGWCYCIVLVIVLSIYVFFTLYFMELLTSRSLIGIGIDKAIISKISLVSSSLEYHILALGYTRVRDDLLNPTQRQRVFIYIGVIICFTAGIIAPGVKFFITFNFTVFQWVRNCTKSFSISLVLTGYTGIYYRD